MMHKKIKQIIRPLIQGLSALAFNLNLSGFASGSIYTGPFKGVCVPVLNCYSCPGAVGACPIGALQSSFAAIGGKLAYYVLGMLLLFSITLGRFFCGWLCPFGAAQGLLHKAPVKKLKIPKRVDAPLRYLKYAALFVFVIGLPLLARNGVNMSSPYFCKWICPAGTLEGGVPLALANSSVRGALGGQFAWKLSLAVAILVLCFFIYIGRSANIFARSARFMVCLQNSAYIDTLWMQAPVRTAPPAHRFVKWGWIPHTSQTAASVFAVGIVSVFARQAP